MTYASYLVPISVKGIVTEDDKVWLRHNERDEWELPGGKIDPGEQPEETVIRELSEELGFDVTVNALVGAYMYTIQKSIDEQHGVLVLMYACKLVSKIGEFELMGEAGEAKFGQFTASEVASLNMPDFYKQAIAKAFNGDRK